MCVCVFACAVLGHSVDKAMVNGDEAHTPPEEAELKPDGKGTADAGEESNEQEVIVIQDTGFIVKIQAPGTEPFDLQARVAAETNGTIWPCVCHLLTALAVAPR